MLLRKAVPVLALTLAAVLTAPVAAAATPADRAADTPAADRVAVTPVAVTPPGGGAAAATGTPPVGGVDDALRALAGANPVIVVGGLSGFAAVYEPLAARLRADGYQVWIYELPQLGLGDITVSAASLRGFVGQVRSATGAAQVDLVAHSEGGLVSRYYIKNLGGGDAVGRYVSLGTPQYGTYVANIVAFLGLGSCAGIVACQQMTIGSSFLAALNAGDDTPGQVRWTTVRTWQDELVRPVDNARLADGATNVLIQSRCPLRVVGHLGLVIDGTTYSIIRQALRDQPINPSCLAL
ncbi:esterase/lipase family protein [Micromonospora radicis]|uniref:Alpha/beta fold hydrolase n=1 Tax=Micromonospora radicis TaxID=1894971 RepID=A0A418MSE1_9ACTN|nr:alpha/beta fold hydrolase [Micromonospora radicis]RIV36946.1 alpha/beta fold hydrolase [Micromonospora radicis]